MPHVPDETGRGQAAISEQQPDRASGRNQKALRGNGIAPGGTTAQRDVVSMKPQAGLSGASTALRTHPAAVYGGPVPGGRGRAVPGESVRIYDTTLRDGTQQVGVSLTLHDKLRLLERLDAFGVDYVEGGWPGSNPKDAEFFRAASRMGLACRLVAFGATRRADTNVAEDKGLRDTLAAGTAAACIVGKSWPLHVREALGTTLEENLRMIAESVRYLKDHGLEVLYDAEHFFDGAADDAAYALETVQAAAEAGADWVVLCDTNGGSLPDHIGRWTGEVVGHLRCPVAIHTHDDGGLGLANVLVALSAGATQVQGTLNGYGERCGNANLCTVIPTLALKLGYRLRCGEHLGDLTPLSRFASDLCNLPPTPGAPYVGPNAFAHKGGLHVSAISRNPRTYEHVPPEQVGNSREVVVSELSGASNLAYKARELGMDWLTPDGRRQLLERVKELEFSGYQFEGAEASFELLARRVLGSHAAYFETLGYSVHMAHGEGSAPGVEATVRVRVEDRVFHTASHGDGPVNALDQALRKALEDPYPVIAEMRLSDYKVRVINGRDGTASRVRVLIASESPDGYWTTVGVSDNILEASWLALVDSLEYGLLRHAARTEASPQAREEAR